MQMRAFALLEFVFGIVVLGLVSITCAKMLLHLKQKELFAQNTSIQTISLQNTLLQISHFLENAKIISIKDNALYFTDDTSNHSITLKNHTLFLDDIMLLDSLKSFEITPIKDDLLITLCAKSLCLQKVFLRYGD